MAKQQPKEWTIECEINEEEILVASLQTRLLNFGEAVRRTTPRRSLRIHEPSHLLDLRGINQLTACPVPPCQTGSVFKERGRMLIISRLKIRGRKISARKCRNKTRNIAIYLRSIRAPTRNIFTARGSIRILSPLVRRRSAIPPATVQLPRSPCYLFSLSSRNFSVAFFDAVRSLVDSALFRGYW